MVFLYRLSKILSQKNQCIFLLIKDQSESQLYQGLQINREREYNPIKYNLLQQKQISSFSLSLYINMNEEFHPDKKKTVPLEIDYMDDKVNDTLSDIHTETNNHIDVNEIVTQTFGSFFKKPNESLKKRPLEAVLQPIVENLSAIKLNPVKVENNLPAQQNLNVIEHNQTQNNNMNAENLITIQNPTITTVNLPQKKESQISIPILVVSIFMYAGIIAGIILIQFPSTVPAAICLFVVPYLVYLVISLRCNTLQSYMRKLKKFQEYKQTYDQMVSTKPQFRFSIYCYNYKILNTKNGTTRQRVTTHRATQNYTPEIWADQSGDIAGIKDIKKYVFIQYKRSYYFADKQSEEKLNSAYKVFIQRNKRDQQHDYFQSFELPGFAEEVGFSMLGHSPHNHCLFYLFIFLGLALPYNCILERSISRYSIKIVKRIGNPS